MHALTKWPRRSLPGLVCALFSLALPRALYSQAAPQPAPDFSGIDQTLDALERLITDTLSSSETLTQQLQDLETNLSAQESLLSEREASTSEQERLLQALQAQLSEMSQIYREQSALSASYERSSRFWKRCTLIGIPVAVVLSGGITALIMAGRR